MWDCATPILAKLPRLPLNGSANGVHASHPLGGSITWSTTISELERYRAYADDWDGQRAKAITGEVIEAGLALVDFLRSHAIVPPKYVMPGFEGTVSFEWRMPDGGTLSLEISGPGTAEFERYVPGGEFEVIKLGEAVPA